MSTPQEILRERLRRARERGASPGPGTVQPRPAVDEPEEPGPRLRTLLQEARESDVTPPPDSGAPGITPPPESIGRRPSESGRREVEQDIPTSLSRIFHEERDRLSLPEEAARGAARVPGQFVEGGGQALQATVTRMEERPSLLSEEVDAKRERLGLPDPFEPLTRTRETVGRRLRQLGGAAEQLGRESREFFPESREVSDMKASGKLDFTDLNFLVSGGAEAIGQVGTQITLALGTGGGSTVAQMLLFAGPTVALEAGGAYRETKDRLLQEGVPEEEAESRAAGVSLSTGVGAVALEQIPAARFILNRFPGAERILSEEIASRLAGRAGGVVGRLISGAGAEAVQEVSQEAWSATVDRIQGENPDAWEGMPDRLKAAALFGAIGGAGGAGVEMGIRAGEGLPPEEGVEGPERPEAGPGPQGEAGAVAATEAQARTLRQRLRQAAGGLRRRAAEIADPSAFVDQTSGVANRAAFQAARERIDEDPDQEWLYLDLTEFKAINDNLGEDQGDERLAEFGEIARGVAAEMGLEERNVMRPGGDEFGIAVPAGADPDAIGEEIARRLPDLDIPGTEFTSRVRFGVGNTWNDARAAGQAKKAEEEGPRFRDVKAPADEGVAQQPTAERRGEEAPVEEAEDISPEIVQSARFQVEPAPEGEEGFVVRNQETSAIVGSATRRDRAEELAAELADQAQVVDIGRRAADDILQDQYDIRPVAQRLEALDQETDPAAHSAAQVLAQRFIEDIEDTISGEDLYQLLLDEVELAAADEDMPGAPGEVRRLLEIVAGREPAPRATVPRETEERPAPPPDLTEEDVQGEIQRRREEGTLPEDIYEIAPSEIDVEPGRFQFKEGTDAAGVTREFQDVETFDPNLAGIIQVWRDPEDGRLKVINGHHRLELANRLDAENVLVRELQVETAEEARLIGALTNIAEGRGTPVDAAKLFRDEGITQDELEQRGISLRGEVARLGVALSNLHPTIFRDVATGRTPERRAAVIGEAGLEPEQQLAVYQMARDLEEKGRRPTNAELEELIRFAQGAGTTETTQETLFGEETIRQSNAVEKAQLSAWVKQRLSRDRRLFGFLTRADRAERIEAEGVGAIDVGRSEDIATTSAQAEELYERLSTRSGSISDALNRAATRLAQGGSENAIRQELYAEVTAALEEVGGRREGARGAEEADEGGAPPDRPAGPGQVRERPRDLFGEEVEQEDVQGELLPTEGPTGLSQAANEALATVSSLEGAIQRGTATGPEIRRYNDARRLLRRQEGMDEQEIRARLQEEDTPSRRDEGTGDLFEDFVSEMAFFGEGRVGAKMDRSLLKKLGANLYTKNPGWVVPKEALQNSIDAVRGQPDGRIDVELEPSKNIFRIRDTGSGMSPEVAANQFMDPGGSEKPGGSSGGYGLAKVGLFGSAENIRMETVARTPEGMFRTVVEGTADDWMAGEMRYEAAEVAEWAQTGTTLELEMDLDAGFDFRESQDFLRRFKKNDRTEIDVRVTIEGRPLEGNPYGSKEFTFPDEPTRVESVDGAEIEIFESEETDATSSVGTIILNHGLYQFYDFVYVSGATVLPKRMLVNVKPTVETTDNKYPFTTSREALKGAAKAQIERALKARSLGEDQGRYTRIVEILRRPTPLTAPGGEGFGVYPSSSGLRPETLERIADAEYLPGLLNSMQQAIVSVLDAAESGYPVGYADFGGVGLSSSWLGLNINFGSLANLYTRIKAEAERLGLSEDELVPEAELPENNLILYNPFSSFKEVQARYPGLNPEELSPVMAGMAWGTIVHEVAHQVARGHDEQFAGVHTRIAGMVARDAARHIEALDRAWAEILAPGSSFHEDAAAIDREQAKDDLLEAVGSHAARMDDPGGPGRRDEPGRDVEGAPVDRAGRGRGRDVDADRVRERPEGRREGEGREGADVRGADAYLDVQHTTSVREQLELTFGSVEAAADVASDLEAEAGDMLEVSIEGVPTTDERRAAVLRGVEAGFAWVPATGHRIASDEGKVDLKATFGLLRSYRHPAAEYWHALVLVPTEDGELEVAHHRMTSSGALDQALVPTADITEAAAIARRLGGQVVLAHNHPSGDPQPSPEDRQITRLAKDIIQTRGAGFGGHFVIDSENAVVMTRGAHDDAQAIHLPQEEGFKDWLQPGAKEIRGQEDVFAYLGGLPHDGGRVDVLLVDTRHKVSAFEARPASDIESMDEWLPGLLRDTASSAVLIGTGDEKRWREVMIRLEDSGIPVLDVLLIPDKVSGLDRGLLNPGRRSGTPITMPIFEEGESERREADLRREEGGPRADRPGPGQEAREGEGRREVGLAAEARTAADSSDDVAARIRRVADQLEAQRTTSTPGRPAGFRASPSDRGFGEEGFLDLSVFTQGRKHPDQTPLFTSPFDEVEARWQAAKGAKRGSMLARTKESLRNMKRAFTRHFPLLDAEESTQMGLTVDALRLEEAAPHWAQAVAYEELRNIVDGLSAPQLDVLTRNLVLPDIIKDIEAGLYGEASAAGDPDQGGKELPFGYENLAAVESDLAAAKEVMDGDPTIRSAFDRRQAFNRRLTEELVAAELLPREVLEDDRYYHRQVIAYLNAMDYQTTGTGGGRDVRLKRKGFQKARVGGGDFNTAYQEAEFEWVAQAYAQLARVQTLERLKDLNDIKGTLKKLAKEMNLSRLAEQTDEDVLLPFRQRIAFSNQSLAELARDGELRGDGPYGHVVESLREEFIAHEAEQADRDPDERTPFQFDHEDWFDFLRDLVIEGDAGAREAATIFKAIRERNSTIKEELGDSFVTWEELIPEGYTVWQPERGNHFFMGLTVEERVLEKAIEENRALQEDEVREMLVVGGPKDQWVIPENLAETMDDFAPTRPGQDPVESLWVQGQQSWKQWVLLNPYRFAKYNLNNMSGDLDIALAYDPKIATHLVQAAKDLARQRRGKASEEVTEEILQATRDGVLQSGLRVAEIPDINQTGAFRLLTGEETRIDQKVIEKYWSNIRGFTDWRENILRLAALRYFRERIAAGETDLYGASSKAEVDAIADPEKRAAKLARELIGDYGNISRGGQWLRRRMIPFYSWLEINASRWVRMVRNTRHEGQTEGRGRRTTAAVGKKVAWNLTKLGLKANLLFLAVNLWNKLFFPEEDDEVNRNRRQLHIILGRRSDGTIISIRFEGALSDFLEWVNLQNYPQDIAELVDGERTARDMVYEAVKAPVEKTINSLEPFVKTIMELSLGRRTWPTIFEEGASFRRRTSPIRDPVAHALDVFSLGRLVDQVRKLPGGQPPRPRRQTPLFDRLLSSILLYQTDPGEAAYWSIRGETFDWLRDQGVEAPSIQPTQRGNALYYWKRAVQWGDEDAADAWREEYMKLGGTTQGLETSIARTHPLASIPQSDRRAFRATLDERERQMLRRAEEWWQATLNSALPTGNPRIGGRRRRRQQRTQPQRRR